MHLDPEVSRYLGGVRSASETREYLDSNLAHWRDHGFGLWILRDATGQFAGRAGLRYVEVEGVRSLEIAYTFDRPYWGRGHATEVAAALVTIWRARRISPSLLGFASVGNLGSRRVLEKTGFSYERDAMHHGELVALYWLQRGE